MDRTTERPSARATGEACLAHATGTMPAQAAPISGAIAGLSCVTLLGAREWAAHAGIAVLLEPGADGSEPETFELGLADSAGRIAVSFGRVEGEDVIAIWRGIARTSGLPGLIVDGNGRIAEPMPQIGRLPLGATTIRRRRSFLVRRPRFLVRRKTARLPAVPLVHRGRALTGHA